MVFQNDIIAGASGAGGYSIEQSIRFNSADSAKLSRTPDSDGSTTTFTISVWVKRSTTTIINSMYQGFSGTSSAGNLRWLLDGRLQFYDNDGTGNGLLTTALFRDPASWYHIVAIWDTSNATSTDRLRLYSNGDRITSFDSSTFPAVNYATTYFNRSAYVQQIGFTSSGSTYSDFLLAEYNFIDGTAVEPSSFGETNSDTGQWVPKEYTGAYGTNGFYLKGQDSSALGDDTSGNGNDFSSSGLAANDQMSDSPTNNWCVLNSINLGTSETLANGNLEVANSASAWRSFSGTHGVSSGKWYWEATQTGTVGGSNAALIGIAEYQEADFARLAVVTKIGPAAGGYAFENWTGNKRDPAETSSSYGTAPTSGQIVGVALDLDNAKIWFSVNNTWQASGDPAGGTNEAFASLPAVEWCPAGSLYNATQTYNFGQNAFAYTPPTGFSALNNANTPDPAIADPSAYFQTTLYEGDGSTQSIDQSENSTFSPNFVWIKNRDATDAHALFDTVRGATEVLSTNSTAAEATNDDTLTAFESDGFALGDDVIVNTNAESYVAWQWDAPTTSTNEDGSIDSTLSVSQTSGFSIGTYTGTGGNATVGHGLGVAPALVIIKERTGTYNGGWYTYHESTGATGYLRLQTTAAFATDSTFMNNTAPTSSVFSLGTNAGPNGTTTYVFYSFAPVEGYSAFGSYEGNGSTNGPMVNLGFRPAFVIMKSVDSTSSWYIFDGKREGYNVDNDALLADTTAVEATANAVDLLSNGFKLRIATDPNVAETFIYAAFAENPFKTANAR